MGEVSVLGQRLKAFRERAGLRKSDLARLTKIPHGTLSYLETGGQAATCVENLVKLSRVFGVQIEDLLHGDPVE
jgi:transcriptional regulator with XRE-family HTH domain